MAQQDWLQPSSQWGDEAIAKVTATVEGRVDERANADALRNLAKVFTWAGKHGEANRLALRAAELTSSDSNTLYLAGNALIDQGDLAAAIDKLAAGYHDQPSRDAQAMCSLGVAFQKRGQPELALEQYQSALRIDSENASAHNNLAALYLAQGRWSEAASHLERAIRINPHYAKAYHNLGVAYTKQSKWTEAIDSFQRAAEVDPDLPAHRDLGNSYQAQGSFHLAVLHYRRALRLDPTFLTTANKLSWLLSTSSQASIRDGAEALRFALRCAEATSYQQPVVLNTLAAAYAETGDLNKPRSGRKRRWNWRRIRCKPGCRQRLARLPVRPATSCVSAPVSPPLRGWVQSAW